MAPEESDVLAELEDDLAAKARESGAAALFTYLETTLSNFVRIGDRQETMIGDTDGDREGEL